MMTSVEPGTALDDIEPVQFTSEVPAVTPVDEAVGKAPPLDGAAVVEVTGGAVVAGTVGRGVVVAVAAGAVVTGTDGRAAADVVGRDGAWLAARAVVGLLCEVESGDPEHAAVTTISKAAPETPRPVIPLRVRVVGMSAPVFWHRRGAVHTLDRKCGREP